MKKIFVLALFLSVYTLASAQTIGKATYQKADVDALFDEFPYAEKTVTEAIKEAMGKKGVKGKSSKDYTIYEVGNAPELGKENYKLYFMVDRKSKKDKDASNVTMLISKGFDQFLIPVAEPTVFENAKSYLANLKAYVGEYALNLKIADQEEEVKKADKAASKLASDLDDLQKKKSKIEKDIEKTTKDQEAQKAELQKQQQILETLKSTRKS